MSEVCRVVFAAGAKRAEMPFIIEKYGCPQKNREKDFSYGEDSDDKSSIQTELTTESSRSTRIQFYLFCFSILCSISSYSGLIDLQSSINISNALGNRSLMLMSISTVICCLFLSPVVIAAFGAKNTILFSQFCYIVYVASNFYPAPYVLLPGGVFLGIAEGFLYAPSLMYCTYFGRKLARIKSGNVKDSVNKFLGHYWGIYQMNEIFGNSISAIILNIGKSASTNTTDVYYPDGVPSTTTNNASAVLPLSTTSLNLTTSSIGAVSTFDLPHQTFNSTVNGYSMCGANDCYNEQEYEAMHGSYIPMSKAAVYAMLGVYTFLAIIALPIMWNTPSLPRRSELFTKTNGNGLLATQVGVCVHQIWRHFKKTLSQLTSWQQLLLTPLTLYHGLYVSFISSEMARAFVSCTIGVEMVGLAMLLGGIVNVVVSFLYGTVSGSDLCRNFLLVMAVIFDATLYIFCLLWKPTEGSIYMGLIVCVVFGFTDGVWSPLLDGKYAKYFSENEEIAYSMNNLWNCVGFTLMYFWTTLLCVHQKIYIQLASLCLGVLSLCGSELYYRRERQSSPI